jgi:hypothetical protein
VAKREFLIAPGKNQKKCVEQLLRAAADLRLDAREYRPKKARSFGVKIVVLKGAPEKMTDEEIKTTIYLFQDGLPAI